MLEDTTGTAPRTVLIDCDPGHDDAIALLLAHGSPKIDLVGISTVAGNQTLAKITHNAQAIAALDISLSPGPTRGMTIVDLRSPAPASCRTKVAVGLDPVRFWALVMDALTRIGDPLAVG